MTILGFVVLYLIWKMPSASPTPPIDWAKERREWKEIFTWPKWEKESKEPLRPIRNWGKL